MNTMLKDYMTGNSKWVEPITARDRYKITRDCESFLDDGIDPWMSSDDIKHLDWDAALSFPVEGGFNTYTNIFMYIVEAHSVLSDCFGEN